MIFQLKYPYIKQTHIIALSLKSKSYYLAKILILILSFLTSQQITIGQETDSLKIILKKATGTEQVDLLNQISKLYEYQDPDSSFFFANEAESQAEILNYRTGLAFAKLNKGNFYTKMGNYPEAIEEFQLSIDLYREEGDKDGLLKAFNNKGNACRLSGDYDMALYNFLESLKVSEEVGYKKGIAYASLNVGLIHATQLGENEMLGLPYFLKALEICREINDLRCVAYAINNIALVYLEQKEYEKALDYHRQSLELKKASGDQFGIGSSLENISDIYIEMGDYEKALTYSFQALEIYSEINDLNGVVYCLLDIGKAYFLMEQFSKAAPYLEEALSKSDDVNSLQLKSGIFQYLYEFNLARKNFKLALDFYQQYTMVKDSIYSENSSEQIARMSALYETEKKEAAINQLTSEKTIQDLKLKKSENMMWFFIVASVLFLLLTGFVFNSYKQKQKANAFLEERNKLEIENKERALSLFGQQVSREVAMELMSESFQSQSKKLFACIMFLDIRNFTPFAESKDPSEIIQYQNDVFGFMIGIITKYKGIINQFLGDGFMATFGAPSSAGNDSLNAVNASLEIIDILKKKCKSGELPDTKVGIGLHSGHIVTGNVGTTERKQYSVTGNTVILASRIEQLNKKFNSELLASNEVIEKLGHNNIKSESLGTIILKGRKEPMRIYRLV